MEDSRQPLLTRRDGHNSNQYDGLDGQPPASPPPATPTNASFASSFVANVHDIPPINGVRDFSREFYRESIKLWFLAGPAIFTSVCQYSLGAITQVFAGQVGTLDLAAVSIENSVIAGFSFGVMVQRH